MTLLLKKQAVEAPYVLRRSLGRHRTVDTAFTFRMGAGFAGDVNRGHPCSIQPSLISPANPIISYGQPVILDATAGNNGGVRALQATDTGLTEIWGVAVRPYPNQQATTSGNYGSVPYGPIAAPQLQPLDVLRGGYVMVPVVGSPVKGGSVFVWIAASGGGHVQGGFEIASSGGSTITLDAVYQWNSPPDANGIAELICSKF